MGGEGEGEGRNSDPTLCQPYYDDIFKKLVELEINANIENIGVLHIKARNCFDEAVERQWRQAVGDWIEENRGRMGKSQEKIADLIDVDVSTVNKWINGESTISLKNFLKLQTRFSKNNLPVKYPTPRADSYRVYG